MKSNASSAIFVLALGLTVRAATAAPSYSMDDVTACSGDAMRLCKDKIPDLDAIETCMQANYKQLHPACKARFAHDK